MAENTVKKLSNTAIPSFCWDRNWTVGEIKKRLREDNSFSVIAWILREAKFSEVWNFVTPQQILTNFDKLESQLGRKAAFWRYILNEWRELGKL